MEIAIENGDIPLLVATDDAFEARQKWLFPNEPYVPYPVLEMLRRAEYQQAETNQRIWNEVVASKTTALQELAPKIGVPTAIIWCDEDRIFHPSGAAILDSQLPNSRVFRLSPCGHVPMLDAPKETGKSYRSFLDTL